MIVYKLTSPSGKVYIGKTEKSADDRFLIHCRESVSGSRPVHKAIRKYGKDKILVETLEVCNEENINEREVYWIDFYDSRNRAKGYNITKGGEGVDSETASALRTAFYETEEGKEWKKSLSKKFKENNPCKKGNVPWNAGTAKPKPPKSPRTVWRTGFKQTDLQKQRAKEAQQGTYKICLSSGEEIIVTGLKEYSVKFSIPYDTLTYLVKTAKESKKWGILSITRLERRPRKSPGITPG